MLDDALVKALVAAAQQRDRRLGGQLVDQRVVEHAAAGRQRDHAPLAPQVDWVLVVDALQRLVHDVDAQHHPGAAAEGRVVDLATAQRRVVAGVEGPQLRPPLGRVAHMALGLKPLEPLGEQRHDIKLHRKLDVLSQEGQVDVDGLRVEVDRAHRVGDQRHEKAGAAGSLTSRPRADRRTDRAAARATTPTAALAVDHAAADQVLGVPLVLVQRRRVGARAPEIGAAQRLDASRDSRPPGAGSAATSVPSRRTISRSRRRRRSPPPHRRAAARAAGSRRTSRRARGRGRRGPR